MHGCWVQMHWDAHGVCQAGPPEAFWPAPALGLLGQEPLYAGLTIWLCLAPLFHPLLPTHPRSRPALDHAPLRP